MRDEDPFGQAVYRCAECRRTQLVLGDFLAKWEVNVKDNEGSVGPGSGGGTSGVGNGGGGNEEGGLGAQGGGEAHTPIKSEVKGERVRETENFQSPRATVFGNRGGCRWRGRGVQGVQRNADRSGSSGGGGQASGTSGGTSEGTSGGEPKVGGACACAGACAAEINVCLLFFYVRLLSFLLNI